MNVLLHILTCWGFDAHITGVSHLVNVDGDALGNLVSDITRQLGRDNLVWDIVAFSASRLLEFRSICVVLASVWGYW